MLRNPNSIPEGDIVIEDILMEPFFITKSPSTGYTVYERIKAGKTGKDYIKTIGYFSNFAGCLKSITKELLNHGNTTHYKTVKEYIQAYENIQDKLLSLSEV